MGPRFQDTMPNTTRTVDGATDVEALAMETCSLPYHEGERPKARAKQSISWYSDDKQCLLYPNVNQMIT
jgi:hypothetical protein